MLGVKSRLKISRLLREVSPHACDLFCRATALQPVCHRSALNSVSVDAILWFAMIRNADQPANLGNFLSFARERPPRVKERP